VPISGYRRKRIARRIVKVSISVPRRLTAAASPTPPPVLVYALRGTMRIICFSRSTISTLTIWCACVPLAWAVSIYDVIELSRKGYSDEEIVNVIETTRSVFQLDAEDIPRLKNLGVSEAVIRKMLEAVPVEQEAADIIRTGSPEAELTAPSDAHIAGNRSEDQIGRSSLTTHMRRTHSESGHNGDPTLPATLRDQFSVQTMFEEAAGDHDHVYVALSSVPILVLRDEGRFQSIEDRARAVARNLAAARRIGQGRFRRSHANGVDLVVYHSVNLREVPIVTVNHHDAYAYDVRSERRVTTDLLASYWAALLNDYWAITFEHRAPSRLVNLHRGDALMLLFEVVNRTGSDEPLNLGLAVQQLPGAIQSHLERLAVAVPDDFDTWPEYVGERS